MSKFQIYKTFNATMLKNIIASYFVFKNVPKTIDDRYLKRAITSSKDLAGFRYNGDVVVSTGAAAGLDLYYRPTYFTPANPYISITDRLEIGKDCAVCYLSENYTKQFNFNQLVNIYASRLADIDVSIDTSVKNSRVCIFWVVDDDKEAIRIGKLIDEMYEEGTPSALAYKTPFTSKGDSIIYPIKARDNIVTSELADARRNVLADFYQYLGIDTLAVDKKERTNLIEMTSNAQQLLITRDIWRVNVNRWCEDMNKLFDLNMSFELKEPEEKEGSGNDQTNDDSE